MDPVQTNGWSKIKTEVAATTEKSESKMLKLAL